MKSNSTWVYVLMLSGCVGTQEPSITAAGGEAQALSFGVPRPGPNGWGAGDEKGNGNTQSYGTRLRCAAHLIDPSSSVYEIGYPFSETMPQSPFGDGPIDFTYKPTFGLPFTRHAGNGESMSGGLGSQGTQMDAIGHFGILDAPWLGDGPFPADRARYYNGFTQADVKPDPNGPMLKLGIDKAVPIITTAVLLDAKAYRGRPLVAGERVTLADVQGMLAAQRLAGRGILPGDAVYIRTGWGAGWRDPSGNPAMTPYYAEGPGLAVDAQQYLAQRTVVLIALDNPFTDPLRSCQLAGACGGPEGTAPDLPFSIHNNNLTGGIHQIQNMKLDQLADDGVYLSCTIVLPLRVVGGAGSAVRPVAIGSRYR